MQQEIARCAISGVGSAGLASAALPAASAAADLTRENRERKVPGTDAAEDAAALESQLIAFPGRSGELERRAKIRAGTLCVVAQVVNRLAQLG